MSPILVFGRLFLLVAVTLLQAQSAQAQDARTPSATVEIDQTQVALLFSGSLGGGTLHYGGQSYPFKIGGLGIGGIGISKVHATGEVYDLRDVADFGGVYGQARAGYALGKQSAGVLWLENPKGVYLKLQAQREGVMLTLGADGVVVRME
jgi:hypothetical protein